MTHPARIRFAPAPGTRVALFARAPEPGFVKTRLIPVLGPGGASDLHRGLLADALRAVEGAAAERRLLYLLEPEGEGGSAACAQPFEWRDIAGVELREQRGAGLGERLATAFAELLDVPGARAVVFGADAPALDTAV